MKTIWSSDLELKYFKCQYCQIVLAFEVFITNNFEWVIHDVSFENQIYYKFSLIFAELEGSYSFYECCYFALFEPMVKLSIHLLNASNNNQLGGTARNVDEYASQIGSDLAILTKW